MGRYPYILLDADMTLLDFHRSEREALCRVLDLYGLPRNEETIQTYSRINDALWKALARGDIDQDFLSVERFATLQRLVGGDSDPRTMNRDFTSFLAREAWLLPGALEFCRTLREAGLELSIATNGMPAAQRGRYHRSGLDQVVPHLFISMELGAQKPNPAFFQTILDKLGVDDRSQAVMVGDGLDTDILGGNRAGIDTIWFNPEGKPLSGPARPTYTAAGYDDILHILLRPCCYTFVPKL